MPIGKLSESEFQVLCKRAGLELTPDQAAEYYPAYGLIEAMVALVRKPRSHMAEPAHVYLHPVEAP